MILGQLIAAILGQTRPSPAEISSVWSGRECIYGDNSERLKTYLPNPRPALASVPSHFTGTEWIWSIFSLSAVTP